MITTAKRQKLCLSLIVLNLLFIWGNSLLPREISSAFSRFIGSLLEGFCPGPSTPAEGEGQNVLRKIAHFAEFCSLGILLSWLARMTCPKKWQFYGIPFVLGAAAAAVDETIQIFVPGRGPQLRDVCIDTLGVLLGIGIMTVIAICIKRKRT